MVGPFWATTENELMDRLEGITIDGALMALHFAPASDIQTCKPLIMPWTEHSDWWLRESSFMALSGLEKDDALYMEILPTLLTMVTDEYHTQPRSRMLSHLKGALKSKKRTSPAGKLILAGLKDAVQTSEIKTGIRSPEGAYNVFEVAKACLQDDPETAVAVAEMIRQRFDQFARLASGQAESTVASSATATMTASRNSSAGGSGGAHGSFSDMADDDTVVHFLLRHARKRCVTAVSRRCRWKPRQTACRPGS